MNPEDMSVALRERQGLEGADMGVRLLQANLGLVYRPWLALMGPLFLACLLTGLVHPMVASVLIWWLAPIGERIVVIVLSRAAFSRTLTCREALAETIQRGRNGLLLQLTLLRFSPNRGMMTPVLALEQPTYAAYRKRAGALLRHRGGAFGLTMAFLHAELFAEFSGVALIAILMPQHAIQWQYWLEVALGNTGSHMMNLMYALIILAIRPFYAASGFGLYLARRTNLEGWDIELAFRSMAKRLAAAMGIILVACLLLPIADVRAQDAAEPAATDQPRELISEIVDNPPFRNEVDKRRYFNFDWLDNLFGEPIDPAGIGAMAMLARVLVLLALGLLIFLAVRACMKIIVPQIDDADPDAGTGGVSFLGEAANAEPMPDNPAAAARRLAEAGRLREALSLLIRAAIVQVRDRFGVRIPKGSTERDCLARVRSGTPDASHQHFHSLLTAWQVVAYADRPVPAAEVIKLADGFEQAYRGTDVPPEVPS